MKTNSALGYLFAAVGLALAPLAYASAAENVSARFIDPRSPEARPFADPGERAIDRLAYTMVTEISSSVARDGAASAIASAHLKGLPMTGGFVAGMPRILAFKLTSLKLRNPANAADGAEQLALKKVQDDLDAGTPPNLLVQRVELPDGTREWRVYKPLALLRQCVACHGRGQDMTPELKTTLEQRFPDDQAAGYRTGEWRGLIRVTVAEPTPNVTPAKVLPASTPAPDNKR